jgi:hypothetical protein
VKSEETFIARQLIGKHIPLGANQHARIEEVAFSVASAALIATQL